MKRIFLLALLSIFLVPDLMAQTRNPMLENTVPLRRGNFVTVDRWNGELRMSDITHENFRQMQRNMEALQRNARNFERTIQNQERIMREQQRTIDNLNRRLNALEREVSSLRRR